MADLVARPVTQELYLVVRYYKTSDSTSGPRGSYELRAYDLDGERVTFWSFGFIKQNSAPFSAFETLEGGTVHITLPANRYTSLPESGEYALLRAEVTYYPGSRTRVGMEVLQFYLPEDFPPGAYNHSYQGPAEV